MRKLINYILKPIISFFESIGEYLLLMSKIFRSSESWDKYLPNIIRSINNEGKSVIWSCDPMHGNTIKSKSGKKTRIFDSIINEVKLNFQIHKTEGTQAGGIHLEMTGQNVTECVGGSQLIEDSDLNSRYHTHCDPRLNANQAIELAFLVSDWLTE